MRRSHGWGAQAQGRGRRREEGGPHLLALHARALHLWVLVHVRATLAAADAETAAQRGALQGCRWIPAPPRRFSHDHSRLRPSFLRMWAERVGAGVRDRPAAEQADLDTYGHFLSGAARWRRAKRCAPARCLSILFNAQKVSVPAHAATPAPLLARRAGLERLSVERRRQGGGGESREPIPCDVVQHPRGRPGPGAPLLVQASGRPCRSRIRPRRPGPCHRLTFRAPVSQFGPARAAGLESPLGQHREGDKAFATGRGVLPGGGGV